MPHRLGVTRAYARDLLIPGQGLDGSRTQIHPSLRATSRSGGTIDLPARRRYGPPPTISAPVKRASCGKRCASISRSKSDLDSPNAGSLGR